MNQSKHLRILQAHNGLSAKIVDKSDFDGIWSSSLCDSASKGLPDNELLRERRIGIIEEMRMVTEKMIIVDWDTGGDIRHFPYWVKRLEQVGADIVVIEDKAFPKINSLIDGNQTLEDIDKFCDKIEAGKKASEDILIFARLESLIAKKSMLSALIRAEAYLGAGADGIVIHSKKRVSAKEVMDFAKRYKEKFTEPLMAIPTTYLLPKQHPFNIVVYANHLLRASLKAMKRYVSGECRKMASVQEIFDLIEK